MRRRKVLTVVGARPQFIKAAPVSRAMQADGSLVEVMVHRLSDPNTGCFAAREQTSFSLGRLLM
jgi:hypothetical protein